MKYTKGPWEYWGRQVGRPKIYSANRGFLITEFPKNKNPEPAVNTANAFLISAAPDMYEALKAVLEDWKEAMFTEAVMPSIAKVREALAKAEGK